jgi:hypothetical protein
MALAALAALAATLSKSRLEKKKASRSRLAFFFQRLNRIDFGYENRPILSLFMTASF